MRPSLPLATGFTEATRDAWLALVDKAIKGADFEKKMVGRAADGLRLEPIYTPADAPVSAGTALPGSSPFTRGTHASPRGLGWDIRQYHSGTDPSAAWEKEPLTIEEALNARMVSYPFTVRDCCLVVDGGGAIVLTSAARAKTLKKKPVYVLGVGETLSHANISSMPDFTVTGASVSGPQAFSMAGVTPKDVRMLSLYDAFTITPILFLEDLGFCANGEGGRFVADGGIAPGGKLAVNTSGGGLSYCHPGMYGLLVMIEAVRQVRGECGPAAL